MINSGGPAQFNERVRHIAEAGIPAVATSQIFGHDALTLLALAGQHVPEIELITAVVPTYPRHPYMLAAQALTVQEVTGGRLTLGIGVSHESIIEDMFGMSFDNPLQHMREYLQVLMPLLHGSPVQFDGETLQVHATPPSIEAPAPQVVVAALGPQMLRATGELADGTCTWMVGPRTIADLTVPTITAAAAAAGRPSPRVIAMLPVCVTSDVDATRAKAAQTYVVYGKLPAYRAMLDREGAAGPADVAIVGDEESVARQLAEFASLGATDFLASPFGSPDDRQRTLDLIAELALKTPTTTEV